MALDQIVELVETRIVPVDREGMLSIQAPNGTFIQAPFEVWIAALLAQLEDVQQAELCARVARIVLEHNGRQGQIIDARQASAFDCIRKQVR